MLPLLSPLLLPLLLPLLFNTVNPIKSSVTITGRIIYRGSSSYISNSRTAGKAPTIP